MAIKHIEEEEEGGVNYKIFAIPFNPSTKTNLPKGISSQGKEFTNSLLSQSPPDKYNFFGFLEKWYIFFTKPLTKADTASLGFMPSAIWSNILPIPKIPELSALRCGLLHIMKL